MTTINKCTRGLADYFKCDFHSQCICDKDLNGTTTIITGANTGIGFETAKTLAQKGSHVIMACRSEERGSVARKKILEENPDLNIDLEIVDIGNQASIRNFVDRIKSKFEKIDILINNAGIFTDSVLNEDGFEIHFAVNHLGHFLLTNLLLDVLKKAPAARIINVSSIGHFVGRFDENRVKKTERHRFIAYCNSKLCNVLFTKELCRQLAGTNVTTVSLHPGTVSTELARDFDKSGLMATYLIPILRNHMFKTPLQGAQTTIHCALNDEIPNHSGCYFSECGVTYCSPLAKDIDTAGKLWNLSKEITGL